jgi:hypothetical protein
MSIVRQFIEQGYASRIQSFDPNICPVETAAGVMKQWMGLGAVTVYMAGAFDMPTPNHLFGLGEARLMAGALACNVDYSTLSGDTDDEIMRTVQDTAASDAVKLMITLSSDEGIRTSKAFKPEKGGGPRPIFGWDTRAYNLASYSIPRSDGTRKVMVDFITSHGENNCQACVEDCTSLDNAYVVAELQPSLVVINAASTHTVEVVLDEVKAGRLPQTTVGFTNELDDQFDDPLIGGRVSTTSIVRRINGLPPALA